MIKYKNETCDKNALDKKRTTALLQTRFHEKKNRYSWSSGESEDMMILEAAM